MPEENRRKVARGWRLWIIAAIVLVIIAVFVALRTTHRFAVVRELDTIREAGLPTSEVELDGWYSQVPVSENAALVVWDAIRLLRKPPSNADPTSGQFGSINTKGDLPPELVEAIASYVGTNQAALRKLHEITELPGSRYPIDLTQGASTLLPHLSSVKAMTILLQLETVHHSEAGRREEAMHSLETAFALACTLRNEPILISEFVRVACVAITLQGLERVLSQHQFTGEELLRLQKHVEQAEEDGRRGYFRALVGERSGAVGVFAMSYAELDQLGASPSFGAFGPMEILSGMAFGARNALGLRDMDLRLYLRTMEGFVNAATNEFPALLLESEAVSRQMDENMSSPSARLAWISKLVLPALGSASKKEAVAAAQLRCARVALAVERYRLDHRGKMPADLAELTPDYLLEVPKNPYDGNPLQFIIQENGYQVSCPPPSFQPTLKPVGFSLRFHRHPANGS